MNLTLYICVVCHVIRIDTLLTFSASFLEVTNIFCAIAFFLTIQSKTWKSTWYTAICGNETYWAACKENKDINRMNNKRCYAFFAQN